MDTHLSITGGPSKFDLMLALFDRKPRLRSLLFRLHGKMSEAELVVFGVEPEGGDGESWIIRGVLKKVMPRLPNDFEPRVVRCHYRTDLRSGLISLNA